MTASQEVTITPRRHRFERAANIAIGINVWSWAVLGLINSGEYSCVVRLCITALHIVVGTLFMIRRPLRRSGNPRDLLAAMPSILISGFALSNAPELPDWTLLPTTLFLTGTLLAIASFASLFSNFSVLPAVRGVTTCGVYSVIRHPAYAGELLLVLACAIAKLNGTAALIFGCAIATVVVRISAEERLLSSSHSAYGSYTEIVRYRLIPGIW